MKKILSLLALGSLMATVANADFLRVEAGAGAWMQTPKGTIDITDGSGALSLDGTYKSNETEASSTYVWAFIKHPVPIVPNLRLEYVTLTDEGISNGKVDGVALPTQGAPTTFDITQYDIIPYYNILDNTFWMTVDLGVDIKVIQTDATVGAVYSDTTPSVKLYNGYKDSSTQAIPLLYLRGRVQIPTTDIGLEADAKAITDGTNTMYDVRAKVDYTLDFIPVVQPGLEVGYRVQQVTVDDGDNQVDLNYAGVYAGLMVRF